MPPRGPGWEAASPGPSRLGEPFLCELGIKVSLLVPVSPPHSVLWVGRGWALGEPLGNVAQLAYFFAYGVLINL